MWPNNQRVLTPDEREKIGRRLRALRVEKGLNQIEIAPKKTRTDPDGVATGTVQAIETNKYEVKEANIEIVAKFLGTSLQALVEEIDGTVKPSDPVLAGLNREDLLIARWFHDATTAIRQRVIQLLKEGEPTTLDMAQSRADAAIDEELHLMETEVAVPSDKPRALPKSRPDEKIRRKK